MRDLLAPLVRPGVRTPGPLIGEEAAGLDTRSMVWRVIAVGILWVFVGLTLMVVPLRHGANYVALQAIVGVAIVLALARSLWLAHLAAEAANRYLTATLGFPVHYRLGPITPGQWRKSIEKKVEDHNKSLHA